MNQNERNISLRNFQLFFVANLQNDCLCLSFHVCLSFLMEDIVCQNLEVLYVLIKAFISHGKHENMRNKNFFKIFQRT